MPNKEQVAGCKEHDDWEAESGPKLSECSLATESLVDAKREVATGHTAVALPDSPHTAPRHRAAAECWGAGRCTPAGKNTDALLHSPFRPGTSPVMPLWLTNGKSCLPKKEIRKSAVSKQYQ